VLLLLLVVFFLNRRSDIPLADLKKKYANKYSKYVEVNGLMVHYRDEGRPLTTFMSTEGASEVKAPILLVHGTGASLHTWDVWVDALKKEHRVIRMDLPAFGLTGPNEQGDYSSEEYLRFLDGFVKALKVQRFHLGGNSLGGKIAWQYALEHPFNVKSLILVDPSGMGDAHNVPAVFKLARTPILSGLIKYITPRSMIAKNLKEVYHDESKVTDDLIDRYHEMTLREGNRQAFIDRAQLIEKDRSGELVNIEQPTLLIWGKEDIWTPFANASRFDKAIPNSTLKVMENTGHVPMEERPLESLKFVRQFLSAQTKSSGSRPSVLPRSLPVEQEFTEQELEALELETMEDVP